MRHSHACHGHSHACHGHSQACHRHSQTQSQFSRPSFRLNLNNFLATSPILDLDVSLDGIRLGPKHCLKKKQKFYIKRI